MRIFWDTSVELSRKEENKIWLLAIGSVVKYLLRKDQLPYDSARVWTGVVLSAYCHILYVHLLDDGYEEYKEVVLVEQVKEVMTEKEYLQRVKQQ